MKRALSLVALSVTLVASAAGADEQRDQARAFFNAGAQAYGVGQYAAAVQAFEASLRLAPHPAIVFSLGQALRRQYFVDKDPAKLLRAVEAYRRYIAEVPQGGRRADAVAALGELDPIAERARGAAAAATEAKAPARLMVTSPTPAAEVVVDGGSSGAAPFIGEIAPGKHKVVVSAKGYDAETREVAVVEGGVAAIDLTLRERPAELVVRAPAGAEIVVDGRIAGATPLAAPLRLAHGRHYVAVLRNGARAFAREVDLVRGERATLDAALERSPQRTAAWITMGVGAASAVAGGVLAGLAVDRQAAAERVLDARTVGTVEPAALDDYDAARASRDRLRTASAITLGAGAALILTGAGLYAFDRPSASAPSRAPERRPDEPARPAVLDLAVAPAVGPGFAMGALVGRF